MVSTPGNLEANWSGGAHSANFDEKVHKPQSKSWASGTLYTLVYRIHVSLCPEGAENIPLGSQVSDLYF